MSSAIYPWRSEVRRMLALSGPIVLAQIGYVSMGFIDTLMVGRLGEEALSALALGNIVFVAPYLVGMGIVMAVGPMVAQAHGAGDEPTVGRAVRQGFWLAACLTIPAFVLLWNAAPILRALGQPEPSIVLASGYARAVVWGFPFAMGFVALRNFVESLSRPRIVMVITTLAVGLNIFLNDALMFGRYGLPELGVRGTGFATATIYFIEFVALVLYVYAVPSLRRYGVFEKLGRPDPVFFRKLLALGWPIGAAYGIEYGLFGAGALMVGQFGPTALGGHQIALNCAAFTFMVPLGVSIATSVRVGQAVGRRDVEGARRAGVVGVGLGLVFMMGTAVLFWTVPRAIIGLYLDLSDPANADVAAMAVSLLSIAAVFQVFDGIQVTTAGALRGMKKTVGPMVIGLIAYWGVGISAAYYWGFAENGGPLGVWWGLVIGLVAAAVGLLVRFRLHLRRLAAGPEGAG